MKFVRLLEQAGFPACCSPDREVEALCYDSRKAASDNAFVALCGTVSDGHAFVQSAYDNGCRAFVVQRPVILPSDADIVQVPDTRAALASLSACLFEHPATRIKAIGITGTKGKTSVAHLIRHMLDETGHKAGLIGTTGIRFGDVVRKTVNTTPESYELQRALSDMEKADCQYACVEVSSQGLMTHRVDGLPFEIGIFTNLSPDHIGPGEHSSFEEYMGWKAQLFRRCRIGILNRDDAHFADMTKDATCIIRTFGMNDQADYWADDVHLLREPGFLGVGFTCHTPSDSFPIRLPQPGRFSVYNALAAIGAGCELGIPLSQIATVLAGAVIPGRIQLIPALPYCTIVVDYAHNELSLRSILTTLREYHPRRLICLFGSVGGRTQLRRQTLAHAAAQLADFSILTSDNPDFEDPVAILEDIEQGMSAAKGHFISIPDRGDAIRYAVDMAKPGDMILLAGKGHEDYQLIRGERIPFCERDVVEEAARQRLSRESSGKS